MRYAVEKMLHLGRQMDVYREQMTEAAIRAVYALNADQPEDAGREAEEYFQLLQRWTDCTRELAELADREDV